MEIVSVLYSLSRCIINVAKFIVAVLRRWSSAYNFSYFTPIHRVPIQCHWDEGRRSAAETGARRLFRKVSWLNFPPLFWFSPFSSNYAELRGRNGSACASRAFRVIFHAKSVNCKFIEISGRFGEWNECAGVLLIYFSFYSMSPFCRLGPVRSVQSRSSPFPAWEEERVCAQRGSSAPNCWIG